MNPKENEKKKDHITTIEKKKPESTIDGMLIKFK